MDIESIAEYITRDFEYYARAVVSEIFSVIRDIVKNGVKLTKINGEIFESSPYCYPVASEDSEDKLDIYPQIFRPKGEVTG